MPKPAWTVRDDGKAWWGPDILGAYSDIEGVVLAGTYEADLALSALVDCVYLAEQVEEANAIAAKGAIVSAKAHRWDEMVKRLAEMVAAITEHAEAGDVMAEHDLGLLEPLLLLAGDDDGG